MSNSFNPFEFVEFARQRWRTAATVIGCAVVAALVLSLVLPKKFTATASVVIEPPGGSDPRISTAVSPVYLESLKTYEQFASSDTVFAEACAKFGLLAAEGSPSIESFKGRVLEVRKPKETKLLRISVTLGNPKLAQALVQYLAERTVKLSNTVGGEGDANAAEKARARAEGARAELANLQDQWASSASGGRQTSLESEVVALTKVQAELASDIAGAQARIAEYSARESAGGDSAETAEFIRQELRAQRAKAAALEISRAGVTREVAAKSEMLSALQGGRDRLQARLRAAQSEADLATKRLAEVEAVAGTRAEQLRIIDPGIVPQRPSSPNLPLNCSAALMLGAVGAFVYLAMRFGLERQRARYARGSFKVAQRGGA